MAYISPGGAFSDAFEEFYLKNAVQERQARLDALEQKREERLDRQAEEEMGLRKQQMAFQQKEKEQADIEKEIGQYGPGDYPPRELIERAKAAGVAIPTATSQAAAAGIEGAAVTGSANPLQGTPIRTPMAGSYAGTFGQREKLRQEGELQNLVQKQAPGSLERQALEYEAATGRSAPSGLFTAQRPGAAGATEPVYRQDPNTGKIEYVGEVPKGSHFMTTPTAPTTRPVNTDQGFVSFTPTRPGTSVSGAPAPVATPAAPLPNPEQPGTTRRAPTASAVPTARGIVRPPTSPSQPRTTSGPIVKPMTDAKGNPIYGPSGPPLTEEGAAPFAVMLASGVSPTSLMSMGMAGSMRTKVANLAADYRTGAKAIPPELVGFVSKVADKATTIQTLKFLQRQEQTASTSADIARDNLQLAEEAGNKVGRTDAKFINNLTNRALREIGIDVTGSTDVGQLSDFETKIYTAIREYAKVASGSSGSVAGLSEGATHEATALLSSAQSPDAFKAAVKAMEADMDNIIKGWHGHYQSLIDHVSDTSGGKSGAIKLKWNTDHTQLVPEG